MSINTNPMPTFNPKPLFSDKANIKYPASKKAIALSEKNPCALYPQMDVFVKLLNGDNRILRWTSIVVIGNLAKVDKKNKVNRIMPRFFKFLREKEMITAANTVKALGVVAQTKPKLKPKIFQEFLKVEKAKYHNKGKISPECRNVVLGHVVNVFGEFNDEIKNNKSIINFLKRQTKNTRPAVKMRAKELLKKIISK